EPGRVAELQSTTPVGEQHANEPVAEHETAVEVDGEVDGAAVLHDPAKRFGVHRRPHRVVPGEFGPRDGGGEQGGDLATGGVAAEHELVWVAAVVGVVIRHPSQCGRGVLDDVAHAVGD